MNFTFDFGTVLACLGSVALTCMIFVSRYTRLESRVESLEDDFKAEKEHNEKNYSKIWIKLNEMATTCTSILVQVSKVEGRLEGKDQN